MIGQRFILKTMRQIITIQHPQSAQHTNGMIGSWTDWDLTEQGINHAHEIGKHLSLELSKKHVTLYASDLLRAKHTADIVASYLKVKPIYSELLREFNLGEAIGKSKLWAQDNKECNVWPDTIDWGENIDDITFKGAESKRDVWKRLEQFRREIMANDDENIILVSHDGTLSIFFALWLGLSIDQINQCHISGKKGGVSFLSEDSKKNRIIHRLNDMSYIQSRS